MTDGENGGGQEFTIGTVVGEIRGLVRQVEQMEGRLNNRIDEVKRDLKESVGTVKTDLEGRIKDQDGRLTKQEKANSAWRWVERGVGILGAFISGWFGGKAGTPAP